MVPIGPVSSPAAPLLLALILGLAPAPAEEHGLAGPYTDPAYLTGVAFGAHSHWLQPWRAWLETVPAARFIDGIGVNLHLHGEDPDVILDHLERHGVRSVRIEIGWGGMDWDEARLATAGDLRPILLACTAHHLRPLILLNAHQGAPGPMHWFDRTLAADAPAGATSIQLTDASDLVIGHSGLCNLSEYWAAEALITAIDGTTLTLSKPLPKALAKAQRIPIATLKHRPFGPAGRDFDDTMAAWLRYVDVVAAFVTSTLGTTAGADRGFDLELWNEMSFGSNVLFINKYYQPARFHYREDAIYGALIAATATHIGEHARDFAGVRIDDGFANTLPWPAAGAEPPRIHAIGKHPYSGRHVFPKDEAPGTRLDAHGRADGYAPDYDCSSFPEYFFTALQTETIARDCAPIATDIYGNAHGASARPGQHCPVWVTEVGFPPTRTASPSIARQLALKAKTTARYLPSTSARASSGSGSSARSNMTIGSASSRTPSATTPRSTTPIPRTMRRSPRRRCRSSRAWPRRWAPASIGSWSPPGRSRSPRSATATTMRCSPGMAARRIRHSSIARCWRSSPTRPMPRASSSRTTS